MKLSTPVEPYSDLFYFVLLSRPEPVSLSLFSLLDLFPFVTYYDCFLLSPAQDYCY